MTVLWKVRVQQGDNSVEFGFDDLGNACRFVQDCMETGDDGTSVIIYESEDKINGLGF